jgi:GAF domain/ANTAR domain
MTDDRERAVTEAFVALATNLADGADVVDLLSALAEDTTRLLDIASTGMLLADHRGVLHVVAASSEATRSLEVFQLQRMQGPCLDCYQSGTPIVVSDLSAETARWPQFVDAAVDAGFASVHAVPMRLRDRVLGTVGLFGTSVGALSEDDLRLGQALAYVASVALVQERAAADRALVNAQLQTALDSRVVLEQAKGVLSQRGDLEMNEAFAALRGYARDHNLRLTDVARSVTTRELPAGRVLEHAAARAGRRTRSRP